MSLCLEVGILPHLRAEDLEAYGFYLSQFSALNEVLVAVGRVPHVEPSDSTLDSWSCEMYGYAGIHYLRRIAAHYWANLELPAPGDDGAAEDPVSQKYYEAAEEEEGPPRPFDHLMLHSDAEGFYLPQRFDPVLVTTEDEDILGTIVGSAVQLAVECTRLAQVLQLPMDLDPDGEEVWAALESQGQKKPGWKRYGIESFTCLRLYQGCQHAIRTGAALVFVSDE